MKTSEKYLSINQLRAKKHATAMLCELFEVSQSGYFASLNRCPSPRKIRREELSKKVITVFHEHGNRYGRPRIYQQLKAEGEQVSEKMIGSIIAKEGLQALKKRPFRPLTTQSVARPRWAPNLLKDFKTQKNNQALATDITYVATREGWLYLAGVIDLHTRVIKGYSIAQNMQTSLIIDALDRAMKQYPGLKGSIIHSDRGCQYTSHEYLNQLSAYGLKVSMSAKGNCYDNAMMESFWSTLKTECFPPNGIFETREIARQKIFEYIEGYYHSRRLHSSLNYITPLAAELAA
ncbi:MAG: IS3 family transposase [Akkermansiaceae bacterium]|nr:IS3 family transposase [Akkermansiaceae bacterium]